jgi:hypothetical protein
LVKKLVKKRRPGKCRHRWKDNMRMKLTEIGWEVVKWIYLTQDMDQWRQEHGNKLSDSKKDR